MSVVSANQTCKHMTLRSSIVSPSIALLALAAAACADPASPVVPVQPDVVQTQQAKSAASVAIAGEYVVTFSDSETEPRGRAVSLLAKHHGKLKHSFASGLKGFSATLSAADAANLATEPGVTRVEQDVEMHATTTVAASSWGLDRLDQRALPLDNSYTYTSAGNGVRVYIVDTGIMPSHQEFAGRAVSGYTAVADGNGTVDCNGHGTHVAGTVGGSSTGVARGVQLVAVRVLDCSGSGSSSGVIAGIDYITTQKKASPSVPMVANLSLGGSFNASLNDAVTRAVAAGVVFAVSAGNSSTDACSQSPAASPSALTVGATESNDGMAGYSNFGSCVDIFAPGSGIISSWIGNSDSYANLSGTSMASPHVAGVAALILGDYPAYSPAQVRSAMVTGATANVVLNLGSGSPNVLLSNLYAAAPVTPPAPPTQPPVIPPAPAPVSISLSVKAQKAGKNNNANLSWSGATASNVDVYRNGALRTSTANDGAYSDSKIPAATYTYKVCQGSTCSATVTVSF